MEAKEENENDLLLSESGKITFGPHFKRHFVSVSFVHSFKVALYSKLALIFYSYQRSSVSELYQVISDRETTEGSA